MNGPGLLEIFLGLLPMLILISAWYVFMRMNNSRSAAYTALQQRKVEALERIATALEKRT